MNERLCDMSPNMMLDIPVSPNKTLIVVIYDDITKNKTEHCVTVC